MVGAVSNRAGVDSKLPNYFFYLHATAPVWSVPLILKSTIICACPLKKSLDLSRISEDILADILVLHNLG